MKYGFALLTVVLAIGFAWLYTWAGKRAIQEYRKENLKGYLRYRRISYYSAIGMYLFGLGAGVFGHLLWIQY